MIFSKHDWHLFREKLPGWQEAYMNRLNLQYAELLSGDGNPSDKFWALYNRIQQDRHHPGVMLRLSKQNMLFDIVALIRDDVIAFSDLEEFSDDLRAAVQHLCDRHQ